MDTQVPLPKKGTEIAWNWRERVKGPLLPGFELGPRKRCPISANISVDEIKKQTFAGVSEKSEAGQRQLEPNHQLS